MAKIYRFGLSRDHDCIDCDLPEQKKLRGKGRAVSDHERAMEIYSKLCAEGYSGSWQQFREQQAKGRYS